MTCIQALNGAELAAAVVAQAFADACGRRDPCHQLRRGKRGAGGTAKGPEREKAWLFLTAGHGNWAEARALWCGICNVDPDLVRAEALRRGPNRELAALLAARAATLARRHAGVAA